MSTPTTVFAVELPTIIQHQIQVLDKSVLGSIRSTGQLLFDRGQVHRSLSTKGQGQALLSVHIE